jgi:arylsulfatase A-like enzyme
MISILTKSAISFVVLIGILSFPSTWQSKSEAKKKPNVIFISFDDLRPELGCYGNNEILTPNLDRLADQGVAFLNTYCQVAVCQPSRASYMTGLRPDSIRSWHLGDHHRGAIPDIKTMPQYFKEFGYHTVSIGKIFHNHVPDSISFDEPDLRPEKYKTADMIDRDAESFHYDDEITARQIEIRAEMIRSRPGVKLYADGWGYGTSVESFDAPESEFYDGAQTDLALETIARLKEREEPFYLAIGYYRPHLPFVAPEKYWNLYNRDSISPATNNYTPIYAPGFAMNSMYELGNCYDMEGIVKHPLVGTLPDSIGRILKHGYYASVSFVDACFGKLMDGLEEMGISDNTIVVIIGDHGWKLGEHGSWGKMTNYENDTRVPLIIRAPGIKGKGRRSERLTELVDVFPTLCELAGIKVPDYLQGTSMVPLLDDPDRAWKSAIFSQFHRRPIESIDGQRYMGYAIRTDRYHYIDWYFWDNENKVPLDHVASELYDHKNDPKENVNIVSDPENVRLVEELRKKLKAGWRFARPSEN